MKLAVAAHGKRVATAVSTKLLYRNIPVLIVASGVVQLLIYHQLLLAGDFRADIIQYLILILALFIIYFVVCFSATKAAPSLTISVRNTRIAAVLVIAFSICFRSLMLFTKPTLSTDILGFAWDGRVFGHGVDPYSFKPSSPQLDWLKNVTYFEFHDHKDVITPYPPVAQFAFLLANYISSSLFGFKLLSTIVDVTNCLLLAYLLNITCKDRLVGGLLLYSWSPLLIIEFSSSGHIDSLPILFILLSLISLTRSRFFVSALAYTFAVWSKTYPILLLPIYLQHLRKREGTSVSLRYFVTVCLVSVALLIPFVASSGLNVFMGQFRYASAWTFNPSLFLLLTICIRGFLNQDMITGTAIRMLTGLVFILVSARIVYIKCPRDLEGIAYSSVTALGLSIILAPTVFPWYLSWILVFCGVIGVNMKTLPWIILSATVNLSYLLQFMKEANMIQIALAEYLPLYSALMIVYATPRIRSRIRL
jgi:hypothetical protein